jgi:SAM-dependent methyltransferase
MVSLRKAIRGIARGPAARIARSVLGRCVKSQEQFRAQISGNCGLEIGGPSSVFQDDGALPLYRDLQALDNCVYSLETLWEGKRAEGLTFHYHAQKPNGFNFIREATKLYGITDCKYDFVLSSHSLEHTANPLGALREWNRVVKPSGAIIVLVPDYRRTFDHCRSPTPLSHMLDDFNSGQDETDTTHVAEIIELHDLSRDPVAGSRDEFRRRSLRNFENRCLHHHVFDETNSRQLFQTAGLTIEILELTKPHHIAILARTPFVGRPKGDHCDFEIKVPSR